MWESWSVSVQHTKSPNILSSLIISFLLLFQLRLLQVHCGVKEQKNWGLPTGFLPNRLSRFVIGNKGASNESPSCLSVQKLAAGQRVYVSESMDFDLHGFATPSKHFQSILLSKVKQLIALLSSTPSWGRCQRKQGGSSFDYKTSVNCADYDYAGIHPRQCASQRSSHPISSQFSSKGFFIIPYHASR